MKFEKKKLLQENKELKERYEILMVKVKKLISLVMEQN